MAELFAALYDALSDLRPKSALGRGALGCITVGLALLGLTFGALELWAWLGH
jgi:hypothetical protein